MEEVLAIKICHARKITGYYARYFKLYAECNIFSLLLVMILIFLPKSFYFLGAYIFLTVSEVYAINAINPNKRLL